MESSWFLRLWERSEKPLTKISPADFLALVRPKCKQITVAGELETLIRAKRKLRIKYGIDPTGSEVHLGHAVPIALLRLFQRRGHEVELVIGDFTARVGDPSGRTEGRKELTEKDVSRNLKTYTKQIGHLIDVRRARVHRNSKWLNPMKLTDFFQVLGAISFGEVAQREDFRARIKSGAGVSMKEANYSALMAIDSMQIKADIEIGGIDQLLNFMHTRDIMSAFKKTPEVVLTTPILEGTAGDGRKMSKSFGNYIALGDTADNQFGLIMSVPDKLVLSYMISFGDVREDEIQELDSYISQNPFDAKKELGMLVVGLLHGLKAAEQARSNFERRFSKKELQKEDEVIVRLKEPMELLDALDLAFGGAQSRGQIRALIRQSAVKRVEGNSLKTLTDEGAQVSDSDLIKVGKKHVFRFRVK